MDINGHAAIVAGGASGLGAATARALTAAGGNVAVVTFLEESAFVYKGTPNEDLAKWTAVLEKVDGKWKYVHGHRGTGQPPK